VPTLENPKHEAYAQARVRGLSQTAAYAEVYGAPHTSSASRLASNASLKNRISELLDEKAKITASIQAQAVAEAVKEVAITVSSLLGEAEQARALAMQNGQVAAAVSAIREKAVLSGNRVERRDMQVQQVSSFEEMDDRELGETLIELCVMRAASLGLDPSTATLEQFAEALRFELAGDLEPVNELSPQRAQIHGPRTKMAKQAKPNAGPATSTADLALLRTRR
jgi:hypothetical protein